MGTKAREIAGKEVKKTIALLNKAYADEWLAYYQYWVGAKVAVGIMRGAVTAELEQHAQEELKHATMLTERIIQLGGEPILNPQGWFKEANCDYKAPTGPKVVALLKQNIEGEQCAIEVYNKLANSVKDKDVITYNMVLEILKDEVEHEEDLEAILRDIQTGK
ncbi:MAG: ferritin-like domain-containing protein [Candidatus Omnitrophica bacterium]|nr:ferritin-like domain-containing protein [Candidatus Omnitrophota bacterium]